MPLRFQPPGQTGRTVFFTGVVISGLVWSALRVLRIPGKYAEAQWIFRYGLGTRRRALVGTLLHPLTILLSPQTVRYVIAGLSFALVVGLLFWIGMVARRALQARGGDPSDAVAWLAIALSPSVVYAVHCIGYFDSLIFLMGAGAISATARLASRAGRVAVAGALLTLATLCHEEALLLLTAPVLVACLTTAKRRGRSFRSGVIDALLTGIGPLAAALWIAAAPPLAGRDFASFLAKFTQARVVYPHEHGTIAFLVKWSLKTNWDLCWYAARQHWVETFVTVPYSLILVPIGFLVFRLLADDGLEPRVTASACLAVCVLAAIGPTALHVVAWDIERIASFIGLCGLLCVQALLPRHVVDLRHPHSPCQHSGQQEVGSRLSASRHQERQLPSQVGVRTGMRTGAVWQLAFAALALTHVEFKPHLADWYAPRAPWETLRELPRELQKLKLPYPYVKPVAPLFENSDFEEGSFVNWRASGTAFGAGPIRGDTPTLRDTYAVPAGNYWVGSYETEVSDRPTGALTSIPFRVTHPRLSFLVGGGADSSRVYVALRTEDGHDLGRFSGTRLELMTQKTVDVSAWLGQQLIIVIVDEADGAWGHINADDFGWAADDAPVHR